jgi:P27 family predicted phage terminase small subunit
MINMGRKPKPRALKVLNGNPGKRPLSADEPEYPLDSNLEPPEELAGESLKEWQRAAPLLLNAGVLTQIDRTALKALCICYARWIDAEKHVRKEGCVVSGSTGSLVMNPYVRVASQALEQMRSLMSDFGMTPAARTRIRTEKSTDNADELEKELFW